MNIFGDKSKSGGFSLIPESQFGRILLLLMAGGGVYAGAVLWQWRIYIAVVLAILIITYIVIRMYMLVSLHRLELAVKRSELLPKEEKKTKVLPEVEPVSMEVYESIPEYPLPEPEPVLDTTPKTFRQLYMDTTLFNPGSSFMLAMDEETGTPINLSRMSALGVGGQPGTGKTVTTLFLLLQLIIRYDGQVKFLIADPHMNVAGEESLWSKVAALEPFLLTVDDIARTVDPDDHDYLATLRKLRDIQNPTTGGVELRSWMKVVDLEMERRKQGKTGEAWVIVLDEFAAIMSDPTTIKPVSDMLTSLNQQARKMNMFSLLITQEFKASAMGGSTDLRNSISGWVVHRMNEANAALALPSAEARKVPYLEVGQVMTYTNGISKIGRVPFAEESDAFELVQAYLPPLPDIYEDVTQKLDPGLEDDEPQVNRVMLPDDFLRTEMEEIKALYAKGLSEKSIAQKVFEAKGSGPELEEAIIQVRDRLKWMVQNANW